VPNSAPSSGPWKSEPREAAKPALKGERGELPALLRRVAAGNDLDRPAAGVAELLQQRFHRAGGQAVAPRMREHGIAARDTDPAHRVAQCRPLVRHVAGLARHQEAAEGMPRVRHCADVGEKAREVGAAHHLRVLGALERSFESAVDPRFGQFRSHALGALQAPAPHARQSRGERLVVRVDAQSHDVDRAAAPGDRDLHAVDEAHAFGLGRRARLGEAAQLVVVGQRPQGHARARRAPRDLGGRERAVGDVRVAVQVDVHGAERNSSIRLASASGWSWCSMCPAFSSVA
jgi:hypothetical protein